MTASMPSSVKERSRRRRDEYLRRRGARRRARRRDGPAMKLSRTTTRQPRSSKARTVWLPMYPAPPVTNTFILTFLQFLQTAAEEFLIHFHAGLIEGVDVGEFASYAMDKQSINMTSPNDRASIRAKCSWRWDGRRQSGLLHSSCGPLPGYCSGASR